MSRMNTHTLAAAALLLMIAAVAPVFAADAVVVTTPTTMVTVPWGDWVLSLREAVIAAVIAAVGIAFRALPANINAMLTSARAIQIIEKGISYGFNTVEGAVAGKTLDVNVGNAVVAQAVQYVIDQAPAKIIAWVGGEEGIKRMIIARLPVGEGALTP